MVKLSGNNVVKFKDSKVCILLSQIGRYDEFNKEFSKATSEGYELKAIHTFASFQILGTGGDTDHLFYFQKLENLENPIKSNEVTVTTSETKHTGKGLKIFCQACGNNNISGAILCKKCGRGI